MADPWRGASDLWRAVFVYAEMPDKLGSRLAEIAEANDADPDPVRKAARAEDTERLIRIAKADFHAQLQQGYLIARGLQAPLSPSSEPIVIPAHLWHALDLDYENDAATAEGLRFVAIRVLHRDEIGLEIGSVIGSGGEPISFTPTSLDERKAEVWIRTQAATGKVWAKRKAFEAARVEIPAVGWNSFKRAWKAFAPPEWKNPGRKS